MATTLPTDQKKPVQQQPMYPPNAFQILEGMQSMLNGALLEIGHSMKNPARASLTFPNTQGLNGPRYNNISISGSWERFNMLADELGTELARAQAVIRRDLAVKRAEREKREAAEKEERAAAVQEDITMEEVDEVKAAEPEEDIVMADEPQPEGKPAEPQAQKTATPKPLAIQTNTTVEAATSDASAQPAPATATSTDDLFGRTPTTAGVNNPDFDSMFEDLTGNNDLNTAGGEQSANTDNDVNFDLLSGLESYANIGENNSNQQNGDANANLEIDFSGLDNHASASSANQAQQQQEQEQKKKEEEQKKKEEEEQKKKEEEEQKKKAEEEKKKAEEEQQNQQQQQQSQDADQQGQNTDFDPNAFQADSTFDELFNYGDFDMGDGSNVNNSETTFDDSFFGI